MAAPGWDYMTNFIETDNFPSAGMGCIGIDARTVEMPMPGNIYIKHGKKFIQK